MEGSHMELEQGSNPEQEPTDTELLYKPEVSTEDSDRCYGEPPEVQSALLAIKTGWNKAKLEINEQAIENGTAQPVNKC